MNKPLVCTKEQAEQAIQIILWMAEEAERDGPGAVEVQLGVEPMQQIRDLAKEILNEA